MRDDYRPKMPERGDRPRAPRAATVCGSARRPGCGVISGLSVASADRGARDRRSAALGRSPVRGGRSRLDRDSDRQLAASRSLPAAATRVAARARALC
jgi:hypothetical protein